MTRREILTEIIGSICFLAFLFGSMLACYVAAPAQPSMHSEAVYQEAQQ